jgi:hypothetical protein
LIGYLGCTVLLISIYYANIWRSQDFPFLSQFLFDQTSNSTNYVTWNTTNIFTPGFIIDEAAVDAQGIPWLTGSYIAYLITSNAGITAAVVHMFLWNYDEIKGGWAWANMANLKRLVTPSTYVFWKNSGARTEEEKKRIRADPTLDPHYKMMVDYNEVPDSWYFGVTVACWITGIVCLYVMKSTLPWWGFIMATIFTVILTLIVGAQYAITGFMFNLQPLMQMLAGYMFPGRPLGMYPTLTSDVQRRTNDHPSQHVLHDLYLQCHSTGMVPASRSQTSSTEQIVAKMCLRHTSYRLPLRRMSELCHDDNVNHPHNLSTSAQLTSEQNC